MMMIPTFELKDYENVMELGSGAFGTVYLVIHTDTRKVYAMKKINNRTSLMSDIENEIKTFQTIGSHPNLISLQGLEKTSKYTYLYMDYIRGKNLVDYIAENEVSIEMKINIFKQLISAVKHMHESGVYHRDIKPENIMITKTGTVKLIDYGLSSTRRYVNSICGTIEFMSPEMIESKKPYDCIKTDIWACGMVLYEMFCGRILPDTESVNEVKIFICAPEIYVPDTELPDIKDLISSIMVKEPSKRPSIDKILSHTLLLA
jgi:serine/threonine protein kinase